MWRFAAKKKNTVHSRYVSPLPPLKVQALSSMWDTMLAMHSSTGAILDRVLDCAHHGADPVLLTHARRRAQRREAVGRAPRVEICAGAGLSQRFEPALLGGRPEPLLGRCLFFFLRTRGALVPARCGDGGVEGFVLFACEEVGHFGTQLPQPGLAVGLACGLRLGLSLVFA